MALQDKILLDVGLQVDDAYIRIDTISGSKSSLDISVNTYVSKDTFLNGAGYLQQKIIKFTPTVEAGSANFIKQGYEHLKTLPEYANATNVPADGSVD